MAPASASAAPTFSLAEMQVLTARAGLVLNPGQMADLVLVWRQLAGLIALLPRDRPLQDDQAFVFRLPPPKSAAATAPPDAGGRKRAVSGEARSAAAPPARARSARPGSAMVGAAAKPGRGKTAPSVPSRAKPPGKPARPKR